MILRNGDGVQELIRGKAGDYHFCRNCELNEACTGKRLLPKIMRCSIDAINFMMANLNYKNYIWKGSYRDQPRWLMQMASIAGNERKEVLNQIEKEKNGSR